MNNGRGLHFSFNSPVILWFAIICLIALCLGFATDNITTTLFFSVYKSSLLDPLTYVRFIGHVLGHNGFAHYINNMMYILLIGPLLEEKYGSKNIVAVILIVALVTGIVNFIFFPQVMLLGASGVAFAFICLSSFTSINDGEVPLTFVLVLILYIGEQVLGMAFEKDNVSQLTHIIGGGVGSVLGFQMNKRM